jgi:hypothetical protein
MSIEPISSVTSSPSVPALLASAVILPANPLVAAAADTPIQILSEINRLEEDEQVPSGSQSLAKIQRDIQLLEEAQRLRGEKAPELGSPAGPGGSEPATPSSAVAADSVVHLIARA